jgi:S-adenosyl methyltransferase
MSSAPEDPVTGAPPTANDGPPPNVDTSVPHSARLWNYWLGGKDNFAVDREVMMLGILNFIPENGEAAAIVNRVMAAMPPAAS